MNGDECEEIEVIEEYKQKVKKVIDDIERYAKKTLENSSYKFQTLMFIDNKRKELEL